ncbi:phytanoyl-CoA dioxygenase family protein [Stappia sediminis]|uniref:phytanoyl-CoA dioxygenase family protein n=1 Tax=Stappia sediminis TaxID=2692190 RepID=UPI001AD8EFBD|nr:phytanoyl-CoA dioxygenase family protein [Stappia sediminis]
MLLAPLHIAALASGAKSFCDNPILGSPWLNGKGLHRQRIKLAENMSDMRRRRLENLVSGQEAESFERDGFIVLENVLADDDFARLSNEVERNRFRATEMKQGNAVTRFIPLPPHLLKSYPALRDFTGGRVFRDRLRYVASTRGDPITYLHTVLTDPGKGKPDPQTAFHSDTFHATAKAWFFLRDVHEEDGPFVYVPGSHRLTPGRLAWEQAQSEHAASHPNRLHARGSFRATADEIRSMGFGEPRSLAVPANTLIVADTHGFHARGPSSRPSVRIGIYGSLRRSPFLPWTGLDPFCLPGIVGRKAVMHEWLDRKMANYKGKKPSLLDVGMLHPGDPAVR